MQCCQPTTFVWGYKFPSTFAFKAALDHLQCCTLLQVLGNLRLPNAAFKADRCPEPVTKLMTVLKSGPGAHLRK